MFSIDGRMTALCFCLAGEPETGDEEDAGSGTVFNQQSD